MEKQPSVLNGGKRSHEVTLLIVVFLLMVFIFLFFYFAIPLLVHAFSKPQPSQIVYSHQMPTPSEELYFSREE